MSVSFGAGNDSTGLNSALSQLQQIGQRGTYTPQMKLPKPKPPTALQPFSGLPLGVGSNTGVTAGTGAVTGDLGRLMSAIRQQESSGNYGAVNRDSGALGGYQIMPSNLPDWSQKALGHQVSRDQFLSSPQIQDQVARYMLGQYLNKYGMAGAAATWYGGDWGRNHMYDRTPQNGYPSMYEYIMSILNKN